MCGNSIIRKNTKAEIARAFKIKLETLRFIEQRILEVDEGG